MKPVIKFYVVYRYWNAIIEDYFDCYGISFMT